MLFIILTEKVKAGFARPPMGPGRPPALFM
jgi:hypothetical protein